MRNGDGDARPMRRLRIDGRGSGLDALSPGHSGRRFVVLAMLGVLVLWGGLYLAFRDWRARYRERAAYGVREVATAIDPLGQVVPPDVPPEAWRQAVAETRAMLVAVTSANVLDLARMQTLRDEVRARVARARPETARDELAGLWNGISDRAAPVLGGRHPRPALLPPRPVRKPARYFPKTTS